MTRMYGLAAVRNREFAGYRKSLICSCTTAQNATFDKDVGGRDITIEIGDRIPSLELFIMTADGPGSILSDELFDGKRVALFGVPGAFTRTCSAKHLPGFVEAAGALRSKGIDEVMCLSVNDALVLAAGGAGARGR